MRSLFLKLMALELLAFLAHATPPNPTMVDGQDEQIKLYEGKPPGEPTREKEGPLPEMVYNKYGVYKFVDEPAIDVFQAKGEKRTRVAVIICPGGSYSGLAYRKEGVATAKWFQSKGITTMVLRYRFAPYRYSVPMNDVQRAVQMVRTDARKWDIDPNRIGLMGFSAGGHAASMATVNHLAADPGSADPAKSESSRPDFSVLVYPVITMEMPTTHAGSRKNLLGPDPDDDLIGQASSHKHVSDRTPPTLIVCSEDDTVVPIRNSQLFFEALKEKGVKCRMLAYRQGGHGYGLGKKGTDATAWPEECLKWMREIGSLN